MTQHIGIVGCNPPGAALCYQTICTQASMSDGDDAVSPEVSLHSHPFSEYMRRISLGNWEGVAQLMLSLAHNLAQLGANFSVAPCNTIHLAFEHVRSRSPVPSLHIAEEVAAEAQRRGIRRVALLGLTLLMESRLYPTEFARVGIETQIPSQNEQESLEQAG